jgi:branched-chain amino acid transport system permease protein
VSRARRLAVGTPAATAAALLALGLLPLLVRRDDVLNLGVVFLLSVALAQSWNVVAGLAGQVNLGHAAFFGLGALVTRTLWTGGVPVGLALGAGAAVATAAGVGLGLVAFRLRGAYFAIGTLALAEVLRLLVGNLLPEVSTLPGPVIAGYRLGARFYLAQALALGSVAVVALLGASRLGLGMEAIREDEAAAEAAGVGALAVKLQAVAVSTALAGLTGGLFAYYHISYYPQHAFSPTWTFDAVLITFIGGVGTVHGPVLGAAFYVLLKEYLALRWVDAHLLIFGALFVACVLVLPGGLVEGGRRLVVWRGRRGGGTPGAPGPRDPGT